MSDLPAGLTVRAPRPDDAEAIYRLMAAYNTRVIGRPDVALAEVVEALSLSTFEPEEHGWLILDDAGSPVNYSHLRFGGSGRHAQLAIASVDSPGSTYYRMRIDHTGSPVGRARLSGRTTTGWTCTRSVRPQTGHR